VPSARHGSLHLPVHGRRQPLQDIGGARRRTPSRLIGAGVAGLAALIIVIVLLLHVLGGGGSSPSKSKTAATTHSANANTNAGAPSDPATLSVAVINSTQRNGYRKATFLTAQPASTLATSVVMYGPGHHADAEAVAQVLGIGSVETIDSATRSLAGTAAVVVVAGDDLSNAASG
jgi:hypothetical protein